MNTAAATRLSGVFLCLFSIFFLIQCNRSNHIQVVSTNFGEEVQLAQNLIFTFSHDINPAYEESDEWEAANYLDIEPKVAGVFKWTSPSELVFSPAEGFRPATEYTVSLSKELVKGVPKEIRQKGVSEEKKTFHTPYLHATDVQTFWDKDKNGEVVAKTQVQFNYAVNNRDLAKYISVAANGQATPVAISGGSGTASPTLVLQGLAVAKEPKELVVSLKQGLPMAQEGHSLKADTQLETTLPSATELSIRDMKTSYENGEGTLTVLTTQRLDAATVKKGAYRITPAVETTAEVVDNTLKIKGNFSPDESYTITLLPTLRGVVGGKLTEEYTQDVFFGELPASIAFTSRKGIYLSSKGEKNVGLQISSVDEVEMKVYKIYENNLVAFSKNNRYEQYNDEGEITTWAYTDDYNGTYGDEILSRKLKTKNLPSARGVSLLNVALPQSNQLRGVYMVSVNSTSDYYVNARRLISLSDIGLIARQSATQDEVVVFANSLLTAGALSGVELNLISSNNQVMATATTNADGVAIFKNLKEKSGAFKTYMITAKLADDFNFLILPDTQVETSRFEVDGKRQNPSGMDAFLYGDRNIYRPGETMHLHAVLRSEKGEKVSDYPLKISVIQPNGRELVSELKNTNSYGAIGLDVPLTRAAVTGTYQVTVAGGDGALIASDRISVEEFMPDRIKVEVTAPDALQLGEPVKITAAAINLFGPPAAGRAYEMDFSLKRLPFTPKGYENYTFEIPGDLTFNNLVREGKTNEQGQATESFTLDAAYADMGTLQASTFVTVMDEMGRPVNRVKRQTIYTQPTFFGIAVSEAYVGTHVPMEIGLAALSQQQKPTNATAQVDIYRIDYQTVIEKNNEGTRYTSRKKEILVQQKTMPINGKTTFRFIPQVSGEYEIRVRRPQAKGYASRTFYAYGYGNTASSSFEVSNEGQVLMTFDKPTYQVGDKAKVLLTTPFAGKLLVTVERQHVMKHFYVETDKKSAEVSFTIEEEMLPNVYVSATLIRPMKDSDMPLTVAHGFASVSVEKESTKLPITISMPTESRSKRKQTVRVSTKANTALTVAVVDEGILQLKNYQTPAIHEFFFRKHALEVTSHDLYALLFPELSLTRLSSIGGDGYDLEKRINPLSNGRSNLVAVWSGELTTGLDGNVDFTFDIPQFSGDLRVMVVAYKENAYGSATHHMKVKDPLVISTGVPRFLSPGDEVVLPISITNTTKNATNATASITTAGVQLLETIGTDSSRTGQSAVSIGAGKEQQLLARIKAPAQVGQATVKVAVRAFNETFTQEINFTVRPPASLQKTFVAGSVLAGQSQQISLAHSFIPSTVSASMVLSKSPMVQYARSLDYLLAYPHGCIEQTISKAFPQLYFADFAQLLGSKRYRSHGDSDWNPRQNVQAAIAKIEAMQLPNGSISYWPGSTDEHWWSSAYAAHFLTEAQKTGYDVNEASFTKLMDYLLGAVSTQEHTTQEGVYTEAGDVQLRTIARREAVYSLYVAALNGSPNQSMMSFFRENARLLTTDSRYLLAAAYKHIGNEQAYTALLPKSYAAANTRQELGGSFSSPLRDLALSLNTLLETDPNNLQIPAMARQLAQALKTGGDVNTQEAAFSFLALGKMAQKANQTDLTASLFADGKLLQKYNNTDVFVDAGLAGRKLTLQTKGKGTLYYFAQQEGVSATGQYVEEDHQLRVRRQFFTRSGQPLTANRFQANQLVVVKVSVSSLQGIAVPNVVVTDMLPAAFEIENPRLNEARDMPWIKDPATPRHFDIRDDRIHFYTDLGATEQHFYYLVRVVSKGRFTIGPVAADAMYDAAYRSYHGGGTIEAL